jgi:lysophospholipase L1-like esterase
MLPGGSCGSGCNETFIRPSIVGERISCSTARIGTSLSLGNIAKILGTLRDLLPKALIIIGNQYDPGITSAAEAAKIIGPFNAGLLVVAQAPGVRVQVANVHDAFQGRNGLLLIERHSGPPDHFEVHPTNAGYRVMADAFAAAAAAAAAR